MNKFTNILILLVSLVLSLYLAEKIAGMIIQKHYRELLAKERFISLREHKPNQNIIVEPAPFMPLPFLNIDTLNTTLRSDSNGFIVTLKNHPDPEFKLFFLGGSTTECLHNDENKRIPELTARLLEKQLLITQVPEVIIQCIL